MLKTLMRAARAVFTDQIRLQRGPEGLKVELAPPDAPRFTHSQLRRQEQQRQLRALLEAMVTELAEVLNATPGVRRRSPHLAQVEGALRVHGLLVLKAMPLPDLTLALQEFEEAVTNWSPVGLATLRSKMAVAIQERRRAGEAEQALPEPSYSQVPPTRPGTPEVTEVSLPPEELMAASRKDAATA